MSETKQTGSVIIRIVICIAILGLAFAGFQVLKSMKKPPARNHDGERSLAVEAVTVDPENVQILITGFGEIDSRTIVPLSAEVSGKVTSIHPRLEAGEIIPQGEVLLKIDDRDYKLEYETARARQKTLERDLELAQSEFQRVSRLFEKNKVGTLSAVEKAESAVNAIIDRITQVKQNLQQAELRLERCVIRAPFTCRITEVEIEKDQYVTPGSKLVTLADDSNLEIIVSLDSRDVINGLRFNDTSLPADLSWFEQLESVPAQIVWVEDDRVRGTGKIDRVVRFDAGTRTIMVAVRLDEVKSGAFPIVDGMFCEVIIKGRVLESVVELPRRAVTFENTVYIAVDNRLHTRPVTVARLEKDRAIISEGLQAGDIVITTRLEQPLENSLLSLSLQDNR